MKEDQQDEQQVDKPRRESEFVESIPDKSRQICEEWITIEEIERRDIFKAITVPYLLELRRWVQDRGLGISERRNSQDGCLCLHGEESGKKEDNREWPHRRKNEVGLEKVSPE